MQKNLASSKNVDLEALRDEAFCMGSETLLAYMPNIVLKALRRTEEYVRQYMYLKDDEKKRLTSWIDRGNKYQLPFAHSITVKEHNGHTVTRASTS